MSGIQAWLQGVTHFSPPALNCTSAPLCAFAIICKAVTHCRFGKIVNFLKDACLCVSFNSLFISVRVFSQSPLLINHQMHDSPLVFQTPPAGWSFPLWVPLPLKSAGRSPTVRETSWVIVFSISCSMEVSVTLRESLFSTLSR